MSKIFDLWNTVAGAFGPSGREDSRACRLMLPERSKAR